MNECQCGHCGACYSRASRRRKRIAARVFDPLERFLAKVDKNGPMSQLGTPCWIWTGARNKRGYSLFGLGNGKVGTAHRWAYEHFVGPTPEATLDHLCHNADQTCRGGPSCPHRACVNPEHLEPATGLDNQLRGRRNQNVTKERCKNNHPFDMTFIDPRTGHPCRGCSICRREAKRRYRERLKAG